MIWNESWVFIHKADLSMHIRRDFGRCKKDMSVKSAAPSNRETMLITMGAIYEREWLNEWFANQRLYTKR